MCPVGPGEWPMATGAWRAGRWQLDLDRVVGLVERHPACGLSATAGSANETIHTESDCVTGRCGARGAMSSSVAAIPLSRLPESGLRLGYMTDSR